MSHFIGITPPPGSNNSSLKRCFDCDHTSQFRINPTTFVFPHNLGTTDVMITCYTETNLQVQPAHIKIIDENKVCIIFSAEQNGRCVIIA